MDPVSFAASLITLLQTVTITAKAVTSLCRRIRDAPVELATLAARLLVLQAELDALKYVQGLDIDKFLAEETRLLIMSALIKVDETINEIHEVCTRALGKAAVRGRLRWALLDHKTAKKNMERLRSVEATLTLLLQVIIISGQSKLLNGVDSLRSMIVEACHEPAHCEEKSPNQISTTRYKGNSQSVLPTNSTSYDFGPWLVPFGVHGNIIQSTNSYHTTYNISMWSQLPLSGLFGRHRFVASFSLRLFPLCQTLSVMNDGFLGIRKIVPDDGDIVTACAKGDLFTVQELFRAGKARLDDITACNSTPLRYAIESGNTELVQFLIDNGAGVNQTFGQSQTSPLAWALRVKQLDIVRLLLNKGASLDHASTLGWTPVFYCWPLLAPNQISMLQFLTLMAAESILNFDLVDSYGWSAIHYAAAYGLDEEITKLVEIGASLITAALPLKWNAIFHAVFYGNVGTFLVLLQHYDPTIIHATDARGWTLLHIAASAGHDQIVRHLLTVGADPYCLTLPFMSHMPESLFNKRCTPEDVAAAQSPERRERYTKALYDLGKFCQMTTEIQETEIEDIFWDAAEEIEILASERCQETQANF